MCHSLNAPASGIQQPFFFIASILHLLLLLLRLFTTSTHAQLLLTLVLSECVLVRVFVCYFIMTFSPFSHFLFTYFACVAVLIVFTVKSFQSGFGNCPGREQGLLQCYILLKKQKQTNMLIIILKEARHSCLDLVYHHSK